MKTKQKILKIHRLINSAGGRLCLILEKMQSIETFEKSIAYQRSLGIEGFVITKEQWYQEQIAICKEEIALHEKCFETELKIINLESDPEGN